MTDYATVLAFCYPGQEWAIDGNDYATLQWFSDTPKPTKAQLDAQWADANYQNQCAAVANARRIAYETQSDGVFFKWQRGDATQAEWQQAVDAVKAANPYPPAP